jgi:hypothetical protein
MLWEYRLNFSGLFDAPASLVEARRKLVEDIRAHPERYISGLRPCEPNNTTLLEIGKRVIGLK